MVVWLNPENIIEIKFPSDADPIYPTTNLLHSDAKVKTKAKDRFLISFNAYNFWVKRYDTVIYNTDLKSELNAAINVVKDNFHLVKDLYPLRSTISSNYQLALLTDALITLGNAQLWWETPPSLRISFSKEKLCSRVFTSVTALDSSPSKEFFNSQLTQLSQPVVPANPFKKSNSNRNRQRGRGRGRTGRRGNSRGRGGYSRGRGGRGGRPRVTICYNCRGEGHIAANCPKPLKPKDKADNQQKN